MGHEQPDHCDRCPACRFVRWPLVLIFGKYDGNRDVAHAHSDASKCQNRLSSELVDVQNGWDSGKEHDNADDTSGKKRSRVIG